MLSAQNILVQSLLFIIRLVLLGRCRYSQHQVFGVLDTLTLLLTRLVKVTVMLARLLAVASAALAGCVVDAATEKLVTACSANLSDASAPVLSPLAAELGSDTAAQLVAFLTESPLGELLLTSEGSTCIANMNGTALGAALVEGFASGSCASALSVTSIPFVQAAIGNLTADADGSSDGSSDGLSSFVRHLGTVPSTEIESFCTIYVADMVPCLRSQVLPSLTTLRAKYSDGCCDAWDDATVADYGYTVSGKLNKMAQLLGDVVCATQAPAADGSGSSQRCGVTFLESWVPNTTVNVTVSDSDAGSDDDSDMTSISGSGSGSDSGNETRVDIITTPELLASSLAANLQIPTDQMCLAAEGEAYNDTNGAAVTTLPTAYMESGCVVALDRLATWVSKLPLAEASSSSDSGSDTASLLQTLFADDGDCVAGSTFLSAISAYLPSAVADAAATAMADACVHVPTTYADGCSFSRAASLIDWDYEPARASQGGSESEEAAASDINSIETVPPDVTSAAPSLAASRSLGLVLMAATVVVVGTM